MITGMQGAIVWTDDIGRLLPFYRDVLGFKPQFESDEFVAFEGAGSGGAQLGLGTHSEVSGKSKDPFRVMLSLTVDDCKAEYERLKGKGVEFIREASAEGDDLIMATLKDPDGNVLQLMQWKRQM
jgi:predicted enzyme related to lactoylglutathione lyase